MLKTKLPARGRALLALLFLLCLLPLSSCSGGDPAPRSGLTGDGNQGGKAGDVLMGSGGGRSDTGSSSGAAGGTLTGVCTGQVCLSTPEETDECDASTGAIISIKSAGAPHPLDAASSSNKCGTKTQVIDWTSTPDAAEDVYVPPPVETYTCPKGQVRIHVRDIWSKLASPTMGVMDARPSAVLVIDVVKNYMQYGARRDSSTCDWYSLCVPNTLTKIQLKAVGADSCPASMQSGQFDVSSLTKNADIWIDYTGSSSTLQADFTAYPNPNVGAGKFRLTSTESDDASELCGEGGSPDTTIPDGYTKIHFRWPWADPEVTGYPGSACADQKLGYVTPPYPSSLKVTGDGCEMQALLEFQDGSCPWYYVLVPNNRWSTDSGTVQIAFRYPDDNVGLWTPALTLPSPRKANEYWIGYVGAVDNTAASIPVCMDWSQQPNSFFFYTQNPGPGYAECGGTETGKFDPCAPPLPDGYHTVHFRYIWAGQKTFTFFPKPALMPHWMELEVSDNKVICYREQDRPWYNCPVPDSYFKEGATWRAVDKTHNPEWNTVKPRPFPSKPADYWIRWDYGKPDIPDTSRFKAFDYYPDGTNGDWSATGNWNDSACAPKPPATPVTVGFSFGGYFPYEITNFAYPFGASLAHVYSESAKVQDLLNAFVYERYLIWRDNYLETSNLVCGDDTARVKTDPPETVSEGQGYGIAISAAMGDKPTFTKLWNFTRHWLSEGKKYCGGLMGWMWDGHLSCQPLDQACESNCDGQQDSAFDGDVDIAIGLVYAAKQWPEFKEAAVGWLLKMECEVNASDGTWSYPTPGDTWDKNCADYPNKPCSYQAGQEGQLNMGYYPPGYFRVFGDYLAKHLDSSYSDDDRETHRKFWYKTAETVYELYERCYDQKDVNPGLLSDWGRYSTPCSIPGGNYDWSRGLWRTAVDAAWFGNRTDLPENQGGSSQHYPTKSRMQAKMDNIQAYYNDFYKKNPPEPNANRFSTLCQDLKPAGDAENCDPAYGHNSYFVNTAMCAYANVFDNGGATSNDIRKEALEEAVSTTVENDRYYQESIGVYTMMFLSGNFPNPNLLPDR